LNVTLVSNLLSNTLLDKLYLSNITSTKSIPFSYMFVKSILLNIQLSIVWSDNNIFLVIVPVKL